MVINNFFEIFRNSKGIEGFKNQKFKYYNLSKSNKNSIFSLTLNFLNSFINKLTTKSKLFFPILQINSDIGYYKGEQVYTFNIMNIEMIKSHLREIVPNILFFYGRNSKTEAYTKVDDGSIIINTKNTFIRDNIDDFQKELKDKNLLEGKNKAIYLFRLLLHEMMGHKKYLYKNSQKPLSPIKVINKEGKLISLVHVNKNEDNENCWKILGDPQEAKGDSGHYLEAYLGQIDGEFVIHMFDEAKNLGKLIDNVELFVDENLEKLKQYIHLKYQLTSCGCGIDCSDMNIDEEINTIENDKKIKSIFLSKKTKRNQKKEEEKIIKKKKTEGEPQKIVIIPECKEKEKKEKYKNIIKSNIINIKEDDKEFEKIVEETNKNQKDYEKSSDLESEENEDDDEEESEEEAEFNEREKEILRRILHNRSYNEIKDIFENRRYKKEDYKLYKKAYFLLRYKE